MKKSLLPKLLAALTPLLLAPSIARAAAAPEPDQVKFAGLSPEDAAKEATVPPGFSLKLFAGEPDVKQPIAMALDHRGRLWVAEAYTYPTRAPEGQGKDRILILEDTDGDGKFDKRTVFIEGLNLVSGMELGFGGVYIGAAPQFLFIPDKNHDDKPDGPPEVLLDGFAYQDTHETLNTFTWGPDGWLYGCHGVFTHSKVGKPGAPDSERVPINAGVWRFHPQTQKFEIFAEGTSNPWGVDFDEHGQCFIEACVIPHLFHMVHGGRFERQAGWHFNQHTYEDIKTIADHRHYAGDKGPHAANGRSDSMGGGHAHAGMMVYQGGGFPKEYNGKLFMGNIHGQRINMDVPERKGSGFVGHHGADFVNFNDRWSQVLNFTYDQDGSVFMIDWYDKNQCHHNNPDGHDRSNGRVFKLVYGATPTSKVDLEKLSDVELAKLQLNPKEFLVRHSRRALQERGSAPEAIPVLKDILWNNKDETRQLRALWTLHVLHAIDDAATLALLSHPAEYVRAFAIQFDSEDHQIGEAALAKMAQLAAKDPSAVVRLYIASALQNVEPARRWPALTGLLAHAEDINDHNLPLLYWYAAEGSVAQDPVHGLDLLKTAKIPKVREYIARRLAGAKAVASN